MEVAWIDTLTKLTWDCLCIFWNYLLSKYSWITVLTIIAVSKVIQLYIYIYVYIYVYIYIYTSIFIFFSIMIYHRILTIAAVLYNRTLFFIHSIYTSLYLLISNSHSYLRPQLPPTVIFLTPKSHRKSSSFLISGCGHTWIIPRYASSIWLPTWEWQIEEM